MLLIEREEEYLSNNSTEAQQVLQYILLKKGSFIFFFYYSLTLQKLMLCNYSLQILDCVSAFHMSCPFNLCLSNTYPSLYKNKLLLLLLVGG